MAFRWFMCCFTLLFLISTNVTYADPKVHKDREHFQALITDADGLQTEVSDIKIYWEEKIDETSFVPHEDRHLLVKRGKATIEIGLKKFRALRYFPNRMGSPWQYFAFAWRETPVGNFPWRAPSAYWVVRNSEKFRSPWRIWQKLN